MVSTLRLSDPKMVDRSRLMYPGRPNAAIPRPMRGSPDFVVTISLYDCGLNRLINVNNGNDPHVVRSPRTLVLADEHKKLGTSSDIIGRTC